MAKITSNFKMAEQKTSQPREGREKGPGNECEEERAHDVTTGLCLQVLAVSI